jgi:hypothetical protein
MDSVLIEALVNLGFGGVIVVLIILDLLVPGHVHKRLLKENESLKEALSLERQRADAGTQAGTVTNQLIGGLIQLATQNRASEAREHSSAAQIADERHRDLLAEGP